VIDPTFSFSTYLGGSGTDVATCVAVDALGDTFIGGSTTSTNFPTDGSEPGPYPTFPGAAGSTQAFFSVIFFQGNGSEAFHLQLLRWHYGNTTVNSIALLQPNGKLVPTSMWPAHHRHGSAHGQSLAGLERRRRNAFVAELNSRATSHVLFVPGRQRQRIAPPRSPPDSLGNIAVAGSTTSTDFPTRIPSRPSTRAGPMAL
jgi:hypothetical protein